MPLADRFWSKVEKSGDVDGCWLWKASVSSTGYGQINVNGRPAKAHRVAWELINGAIGEGLCACHRCDTPLCVRAERDPSTSHIFLGTQADNMRDMAVKGRSSQWKRRKERPAPRGPAIGSRNGNSRLTETEVAVIFSRYVVGGVSQRALAAEFGIDQQIVGRIARGRMWRHVTEPLLLAAESLP